MKYFTVKELTHSNTAVKNNIDNTPSAEIQKRLELLIDNLLDPIRDMWGSPLMVSSGYRCSKLNKLVKGSSTSNHLNGCAADLYPKDNTKINRLKLFNMIKNSKLDFDELIWESGCIHVAYREKGNRHHVLDLSWKY